MSIYPSSLEENKLFKKGFKYIAGCDEAGIGAWAGPLIAAAVILPLDCKIPKLKDSKHLNPVYRERYFKEITKKALAWSVGEIKESEIDKFGLAKVKIKLIQSTLKNLSLKPDFVLLDGYNYKELKMPHKAIIKGDTKIKSITAASIIAKVIRDRILIKLDEKYPQYGFKKHKGYGTKMHQKALAQFGICEIHRKSYGPIKKFI